MKKSHAQRTGMSPIKAGILLIVLILIGVFFAFTKQIPGKQHYEIKAVVQTSNLLAKGSVVRIAGVNVGKVVGSGRYRDSNLAEITMRIDDNGRPVRKDATIKIRPRLFLEGNFFVDLQPGTPGAPQMPNGGVIPVGKTAVPVQFDQVLSSLKADSRKALQQTLQGLGAGFGSKSTAQEDISQDPEVAGLTGGQALNRTLATSADSLRDGAKVANALGGVDKGDLSRALSGIGDVTSQLAANQGQLVSLVDHFDSTMRTIASRSPELQATIQKLSVTAARGKLTFAQLNEALPPTRQAVRDLTPAMEEVPNAVAASRPWLKQAKSLVSPAELQGLLDDLTPSLGDFAQHLHTDRTWIPKLDAFSRCMNKVFLPTLMVKVDDGPLSSGVENYKEFWYAMVGQAGVGQSFDGNGTKLRLLASGGATGIKTGLSNISGFPLFTNLTSPSAGTSPAFSGKVPLVRRDVRCDQNPVPDVNGPASRGPGDGSAPSAPAPPAPPMNVEAKK